LSSVIFRRAQLTGTLNVRRPGDDQRVIALGRGNVPSWLCRHSAQNG
jgi:hypothetical protein